MKTRSNRIAAIVAVALVAAAALFFLWRSDRRAASRPAAPASAASAPTPLLATTPHDDPAPAALAGRVTDAGGLPLAGALVRLAAAREDDGAPDVATARTAADGAYRLDALPPGRYLATASAPSHLPRFAPEATLRSGETSALDFALDAGGRAISGTVSDATGGPIVGALVEATPIHGMLSQRSPQVAAAITDGAGHFIVQVGDGRQRVAASHPEYVPASQDLDVGATGARADFALVPGGVVEGVVLELGGGTPVAGARVTVEREGLAGLPFGAARATGQRRAAVTAGADGHFRVTGLEPGTLRLGARAPGRWSLEPTIVALGVAEPVSGVEIFVTSSLSIAGTVTVEGGGPAAGAHVTVMAPDRASGVIADERGAFFVDGLEAGDYTLIARGATWLPTAPQKLTLGGRSLDAVRLTVREGAMIRGRVEPAGVAEIAVDRGDELPSPQLMLRGAPSSTLAETDGHFVIGPFEPGAVALTARAPDGRRGECTVEVGAAGADDVVIALAERASIAGRVVDGRGEPVRGAVVSVRPVRRDRRVTMIVNGLDVSADRAPVAADGSFVVRGLSAGDYELGVLDERGDRLSWAKPADRAQPAAPLAMALSDNEQRRGVELAIAIPDGVIRGVAIGPDGKPLADAWVTVSAVSGFAPHHGGPGPDGGGGPPPAAGGPDDGAPAEHVESRMVMMFVDDDGGSGGGGISPVLSDDSGRFEIRGLRRIPYQLLAEGQKGRARGSLAGVTPDADVTLRLAALTELSGTVTAGGQPVTDFTIELDGPAHHRQRFRAANGRFSIARIDPGAYHVVASSAVGTGRVDATAVSGENVAVAIALIGHGRVIGKVVDTAGQPVAQAPIVTAPFRADGHLALTIEGEPPTTADDGTFAIDVEAGKRLLLVLGPTGPSARTEVIVTTGQTTDAGTITMAGAGSSE